LFISTFSDKDICSDIDTLEHLKLAVSCEEHDYHCEVFYMDWPCWLGATTC